MALGAIYFQAIILRDPVDIKYYSHIQLGSLRFAHLFFVNYLA